MPGYNIPGAMDFAFAFSCHGHLHQHLHAEIFKKKKGIISRRWLADLKKRETPFFFHFFFIRIGVMVIFRAGRKRQGIIEYLESNNK